MCLIHKVFVHELLETTEQLQNIINHAGRPVGVLLWCPVDCLNLNAVQYQGNPDFLFSYVQNIICFSVLNGLTIKYIKGTSRDATKPWNNTFWNLLESKGHLARGYYKITFSSLSPGFLKNPQEVI